MNVHLQPQGMKSHILIDTPTLLGDGSLLLQCFENFLEYGLNSEIYHWRKSGDGHAYTIQTDGSKKARSSWMC